MSRRACVKLHVHTQAAKFQMALCRAHSHKKLMQKACKFFKTQIYKVFSPFCEGKTRKFHNTKIVRVIRR
ncbi:hypothetical protein A4T55_25790 [Escherichia coli]|nr:hypothetical protein A4T55_25790 [Escherichia coli]TFA12337.1 hypothetical protein BON85_12155 [Escherichia coli]